MSFSSLHLSHPLVLQLWGDVVVSHNLYKRFSTLWLHLKCPRLIGIPPLPAWLPVLPSQLFFSLTALSTSQPATTFVSYQRGRRMRERKLTFLPPCLFLTIKRLSYATELDQIWMKMYSEIQIQRVTSHLIWFFGTSFFEIYSLEMLLPQFIMNSFCHPILIYRY